MRLSINGYWCFAVLCLSCASDESSETSSETPGVTAEATTPGAVGSETTPSTGSDGDPTPSPEPENAGGSAGGTVAPIPVVATPNDTDEPPAVPTPEPIDDPSTGGAAMTPDVPEPAMSEPEPSVAGSAGQTGSAGSPTDEGSAGAAGSPVTPEPEQEPEADVVDTGAAENFSFFITSYQQLIDLAGSEDGFGGDLRYNGATTGLEGADAICQELARRVGFGERSWRAFLSTSAENAIDRIGSGPWYDFAGNLVADDVNGLTTGDRPAGGCCDAGTYDELGIFHDGNTDVNNDGDDDDDHDTMTASNADGTYAGFSCDDWTSTTAQPEGGQQQGGGGPPGGGGGGIMMGHSWPARSGQGFIQAHGGHACGAGTNFVQDGAGDSSVVGGGGGYGGFYCFALPE